MENERIKKLIKAIELTVRNMKGTQEEHLAIESYCNGIYEAADKGKKE